MIRRPLTEIVVKLQDIEDYQAQLLQGEASADEMEEDKPTWVLTMKPSDHVHNRIGYNPQQTARTQPVVRRTP